MRFQNAARPRKTSIPSYCFAKRLPSFGTKLARNVKKGKEEKRDGERGKGMMKYLQRSSRSSWGGSVDLPGPPPPFPPLFDPAIAPRPPPPRPPRLPRLRRSDSVTSKDAQDVEREKKRKKEEEPVCVHIQTIGKSSLLPPPPPSSLFTTHNGSAEAKVTTP